MKRPDWRAPLEAAMHSAVEYLESLPDRPVRASTTVEELRAAMGGPLPDSPIDATTVTRDLVTAAENGIVSTPSGRFFGFVIGGSLPAAVAADWLTSAWDQNAGIYAVAPAAAVAEEVALAWLRDLLGLPRHVSGGFVTGCQMANFTALAAARHHVLKGVDWDVERDGLNGAPPLRVLASKDRHATIDRALRYLGVGTGAILEIDADDQGRMRTDSLDRALQSVRPPVIVAAQVGNVNTGACDDVDTICELAHGHGAWVHVDGAFGLWAHVSERFAHLVRGIEKADSWATDAHKWLSVPYDSGLMFCAHPHAHLGATGVRASYLIHAEHQERDPLEWTPEFSRRARGFTVYAALRSLGRQGVREIVERNCDLARDLADRLERVPGIRLLADVCLNQVLFRWVSGRGDEADDQLNQALVAGIQQDDVCWLSGTNWRGRSAVRVSLSNWSTDATDIERTADEIARVGERLAGR